MLQTFTHLTDVDFENLPDNIRSVLGTNDGALKAEFLIHGFLLEWYGTGLTDTVVYDQKIISQNDDVTPENSALMIASVTLRRAIRASLAEDDDAGQHECFERVHRFI